MPRSAKTPRRFLLVFSDTGGGHRAAAQAVREQLLRLYGAAATVEMVDVFVESRRWPFDHFPRWYPTLVRLKSIPWGIFYHLTDHRELMRTAGWLSWPYTRHSLFRFLHQHPADVIVSFHALQNDMLRRAARRALPNVPVVSVVLDLVTVHAAWFTPGMDLYMVPTTEARDRALRLGVPSERLEVMGGMPVRQAFVAARSCSQAEARKQLGVSPGTPLVLLVGGGEGMGPLVQVTDALARCRPDAQLVAVAGRNQQLQAQLKSLDFPVPVRVEGFVSNLELWMRAADLLVTKAGPNTLIEAAVSGLPMVIYSALWGQEEGNADYIVRRGAGVWAPRPRQAAEAVMALLADSERRVEMSARARALADPLVTERISRRLWELAGTGRRPFTGSGHKRKRGRGGYRDALQPERRRP